MMVSFAAAIEGGVAFDSEITHTDDTKSSRKSSISAKFGLSALFESLFDAGIEAKGDSAKENTSSETRKEQRAHTEASIAILLYDALAKNEGFLLRPSSSDEISSMEHGSLIELSGQLKKNAIDAMIDTMDVVNIMGSLSGNSSKNQTHKQIASLRNALHADRTRTPLSNVILRCDRPEGLTAVLTLRTDNLRDLTLSELHKNTVRVVGKATRTISASESMSPFENYGMSLMLPETLANLMATLEATEGFRVELGDVEVTGLAVQVLPLMVFV